MLRVCFNELTYLLMYLHLGSTKDVTATFAPDHGGCTYSDLCYIDLFGQVYLYKLLYLTYYSYDHFFGAQRVFLLFLCRRGPDRVTYNSKSLKNNH